jgi:hypothetical protein
MLFILRAQMHVVGAIQWFAMQLLQKRTFEKGEKRQGREGEEIGGWRKGEWAGTGITNSALNTRSGGHFSEAKTEPFCHRHYHPPLENGNDVCGINWSLLGSSLFISSTRLEWYLITNLL